MDLENLDQPAYAVCDCHRRHFLTLLDGPLATQEEAQAQLDEILAECPTSFIARIRPVPVVSKLADLPEDQTHMPFVAVSWNSRVGSSHQLKVLTRPSMMLNGVEQYAQVDRIENPNRYHFTLEILDDDPEWCLQSRPKEKRPDRFASKASPAP